MRHGHLHFFEQAEQNPQFFHAFQPGLAFFQKTFKDGGLSGKRTCQSQDRHQFVNGRCINAPSCQFFLDGIQADFFQLVDRHRDIGHLVRMAYRFRNPVQDLAVVDLDHDPDPETGKDFLHHLHQFGFVQQGIRSDHIGIALVKLAVTSLLRTIGPPYGLYLVAFEREAEFILVLDHETGERHSQVVTKPFLADFRQQGPAQRLGIRIMALPLALGIDQARLVGEITGIENLEEQLVAFFPVFARQSGQVFHGRRFDRQVAVQAIDFAYGFKDIVPAPHLHRREIPGSFYCTRLH